MKAKKGVSIVNAFQSILRKSNRKPNKIWVDKGGEFYNNSFKKWLRDNDIAMYSTHNVGKSVVAERFIRAIKNKTYKHILQYQKYLNGEEIIGIFYEKELQKIYQQGLRIEKVIKKKGNKLYVK